MPAASPEPVWRNALTALWPEPHRVSLQRRPQGLSQGTTFLLLPKPSRATLIVPTAPRRVTAAALRNYKSPSTRRGRWQATGLQQAGRFGFAKMVPGVARITAVDSSDSLVNHLSDVMREQITVGIHLGPPRANQKPVLQIMRSSGECIAFAKVGINPLTCERVASEISALQRVTEADLTHLSVPRVLHHGTWNSLAYVVLAPVQTWAAEGIRKSSRLAAMRELAEVFGRHSVPLRDLDWWKQTQEHLAAASSDREGRALASAAAVVTDRWGDRRIDIGTAHGDWTPWNMATPSGRCVVWDWERFSEGIPIGFDALHYDLQTTVRIKGKSPREALECVAARADHLVGQNGAAPTDGDLVLALYMVGLGERFVSDGQLKAEARKGSLFTWLLPGMEALLQRQESGPDR